MLRELQKAGLAADAHEAARMRQLVERRNARVNRCICGAVLPDRDALKACRRSHTSQPYAGHVTNPVRL
jgi:hypothetical protein